MAQLLRTITVPNLRNVDSWLRVNDPHYVPLINNNFSSIEISIKDNENHPIHFTNNSFMSVVKLHFRPRKNYGL